ncbi:MAG: PilZ domain-containing protein [Deferrisomatales bacterium]|nr:PilZ domain-containing protein [Deferrisomatales bacterium]
MEQQRWAPRMEALHILHYQLVDPEGLYAARGMGRTLNASEEGLLLEVHEPLQVGQELRITVGLEEDLVDLRGRVVHAKAAGDTAYHAGVAFLELDARDREVLGSYLRALRAQGD